MEYYKVKLPSLDADKTYYLTHRYYGVVEVRGVDISIIGKIITTPDKTDFELWVEVHGTDCKYTLDDIHVKRGNLLQPVELVSQTLRLGFKSLHGSDVTIPVNEDMSLYYNLWVCKSDYTPYRIPSLRDSELESRRDYKLNDGTFWCTSQEPEFPEDDVYGSESEVRFYCNCDAVSDKSMADIMRVDDKELDAINGMLTQLKEYMAARNIVMVYDDDYNLTRVYRNCGFPDGYSVVNEDRTNQHPWSITVPTSALRPTKEIIYDRTNDCWCPQLNYKEPESEKEGNDE